MGGKKARAELLWPVELREEVDRARGLVSRNAWVEVAIREKLERDGGVVFERPVVARSRPAAVVAESGSEGGPDARGDRAGSSPVPASPRAPLAGFNRATRLGVPARPVPRRS